MDNTSLRPSEIARRRSHRRKRSITAALGGTILVFALIGIGICLFYLIGFGVKTARSFAAPTVTSKTYETYLSFIVGLDPPPYDSLKDANATWMLKTAVWATAKEGNDSGTYGRTDDGREIVPTSDIIKNFDKFFGASAEPVYYTFSDNGTSFEYDSKLKCFYIPVNAITHIFTPKVTKIVKAGNKVTLTVQYLPSSGWTQKADGTIVPPPPSKTMLYVLTGGNGNYVVNAIKNMPSSQSQASSVVSDSSSASSVIPGSSSAVSPAS
jgi:hypothetical protein